jgi:cyclic-di-GMP phosphodiesterase TipF (flagellum assembly factor)
MRAGLLVVGIAVLACGAAGLLLVSAAARNLPTAGPTLLTAAATLLLAAAAATFSWRAVRRTREMAAELERLARSVDAAIGDLAARADREKAALAELREAVYREPGATQTRAAPDRLDATTQSPPAANAAGHSPAAVNAEKPPPAHVAIPPQPPQPSPQAVQPATQPLEPGVQAALHRFMKAGKAELSVQPIISVARGSARGYEVHVNVAAGEGQFHLGRLRRELLRHEAASFERLVVISAADAARRRLVQASEAIPLHVAISDALLNGEEALAAVLDLFRSYPGVAPSLVLSLPSNVAAGEQSSLKRLAATGVGLAVEGWDGSEVEFQALQRLGFRFLKLPADRLLDRDDPDNIAPAIAMLDMAAETGLQIVATEVGTDQDAVALLDLCIYMITGPRFSGPRRLTPEAGDQSRPARMRNR